MNAAQAPLSSVEAALTGLVMLIVVVFELTWVIVRHIVVMPMKERTRYSHRYRGAASSR